MIKKYYEVKRNLLEVYNFVFMRAKFGLSSCAI